MWFFAAFVAATIPTDWQDDIQRGDKYYAETDQSVPDHLRASIGNGFLATIVGSTSVYLAGVFNAKAIEGPSHRARIPGVFTAKIQNGKVSGTALDIRRAIFYRRSLVNDIQIEQRWYAHYALPSIFVMEVDIVAPTGSGNVTISLEETTGGPSSDLKWGQASCAAGKDTVCWNGSTAVPELDGGPLTGVALAMDTVPVKLEAPRGTTTRFTFVAAFRTSFESNNALAEAVRDYQTAKKLSQQPGELVKGHLEAWKTLWESGISIKGPSDGQATSLAGAVNTSLYYILSSLRADRPFHLSPGGLASNSYNGHSFWDGETWMYPPLLLLHPALAKSMIDYRVARLDQAIAKARSYSPPFGGAMVPWESAFTGAETCPDTAPTGAREVHISGDVSFAIRQYFHVTSDITALKQAYPLLREIAEYWVSKARQTADGSFHIDDVIPPDEYHDHVTDSVYTNYVAQISLNFATEAANLVGEKPSSRWAAVARNLTLLFDSSRNIHPEYEGYKNDVIKQADIVLLGFPLMMPMSKSVREADLKFYEKITDNEGPAMTWGMHAVGYIELGQLEEAHKNFLRSYANVQKPYLVWTETPTGGATNFITGAGGFLQSVIFGYGGLRVGENALTCNPTLPTGVDELAIRGVWYLGNQLEFIVASVGTTITLIRNDTRAAALLVRTATSDIPLHENERLVLDGAFSVVGQFT